MLATVLVLIALAGICLPSDIVRLLKRLNISLGLSDIQITIVFAMQIACIGLSVIDRLVGRLRK